MRPPDRRRPRRTGRLVPAFLLVLLALETTGVPAGRSETTVDSTLIRAAQDSIDITASVALPPSGQHETLPAVAQPFRPGERLKFSVQYGIIHAGTAWLEVA